LLVEKQSIHNWLLPYLLVLPLQCFGSVDGQHKGHPARKNPLQPNHEGHWKKQAMILHEHQEKSMKMK